MGSIGTIVGSFDHLPDWQRRDIERIMKAREEEQRRLEAALAAAPSRQARRYMIRKGLV